MDECSPSRGPPKSVPSPEPVTWVVPWSSLGLVRIIEFIGFLVGFVLPKITFMLVRFGPIHRPRPIVEGNLLAYVGQFSARV
jgi:hypothetical protein